MKIELTDKEIIIAEFDDVLLQNSRDIETADQGQSLTFEPEEAGDGDAVNGFFVQLKSWSGDKTHPVFKQMFNRRVRVVVIVEQVF